MLTFQIYIKKNAKQNYFAFLYINNKKENNITRLTQKRKQEIEDKFNNSELGKILLDIRTELRGQVW